MKLLLDTHVLLWWLTRSPGLTRRQERVLEEASGDRPVYVSDISLWEIATLASLGRIRLRRPPRDWLEAAVSPPLVRRISLSPAIAAEVAELPEAFHRDPADRIIVASARTAGAAVVTQDRRIIESALVETIV